jgi:hypothetical protein
MIRGLGAQTADDRLLQQVTASLESHALFTFREWQKQQQGATKKRAANVSQAIQDYTDHIKSGDKTLTMHRCDRLAALRSERQDHFHGLTIMTKSSFGSSFSLPCPQSTPKKGAGGLVHRQTAETATHYLTNFFYPKKRSVRVVL